MPNKISGTVTSISETGGLVTDISESSLSGVPTDESVRIECSGHQTMGLFPEDHNQPDATLLAIKGEFLRIELVGVSISEMLGIGVGELVTVEW